MERLVGFWWTFGALPLAAKGLLDLVSWQSVRKMRLIVQLLVLPRATESGVGTLTVVVIVH